MPQTAFFWDERCFWHSGGNYALTARVGGLVQPLAAGGLPENPETKRRLKNLLDVSGLAGQLACQSGEPATRKELLRVHGAAYIDEFKRLSDTGGGELGERTPFGFGGFEIATLSAGLVRSALYSVLQGTYRNAYALSRPPGHHCLPDWPNGFCLLNNIGIAIKAALADGLAERIAVVDWDVHHGNGTEAVFYDDPNVLTISIHQERNYPLDTGGVETQGKGAGLGFNMNIPLPPGAGHATYIEAMQRLALPKLNAFKPDVIIIACGYDASGVDPLGRMLAGSDTFRQMTRMAIGVADAHSNGRLVMAHEGGYSELHVPFCGHAVLEEMSGSAITAKDPLGPRLSGQQPAPASQAFFSGLIDSMVRHFAR